VVLDAAGHVIDDPRGFLCPLALGTVNVTVTALGRRISSEVRIIPVPKLDSGNIRSEPIPEGTCGFPSFSRGRWPGFGCIALDRQVLQPLGGVR